MLDNYRELIDELLGTPTRLRALAGERGADSLPADTLRLMAELRDRDRVLHERLQTMLRQRDPWLPAITASPATAPDDPAALLTEVDTGRSDLVSMLVNLSLKDWERSAIHETDGEISLAEEVERHVDFDEEQMARIEASIGSD